MDRPNQKKRNFLKPFLVISLLILMAAVALNGCTVPTIMLPEDATAAAQVSSNVKATVDAAIALAVKATLTAVSSDDRVTANAANEEGQAVATVTITPATVEADDTATTPMLITPTPDRSAEIMAIILQNTRHFRGNPDAAVTIVEFSDFQ